MLQEDLSDVNDLQISLSSCSVTALFSAYEPGSTEMLHWDLNASELEVFIIRCGGRCE